MRIGHAVIPLALGLLGLAGCGGSDESAGPAASPGPSKPPPPSCDAGRGAQSVAAGFSRYDVDLGGAGPGYVAAGDVDGDTRTDLVVSRLGRVVADGAMVTLSPSEVVLYRRGDSLGCWHAETIVAATDKIYFANEPTLRDLDGDGDLDLLVPAGFFVCQFDPKVGPCGALVWFENTKPGWKRHDVVPFGDTSFYHRTALVDFDGDGKLDIVTGAETGSGAETRWFRGVDGPDRFDPKPNVLGKHGGSFPVVFDFDGDGDLDVGAGQYFVKDESFAWFERTPSGFEPHVLDATSGRGFQLAAVPNLQGDGQTRLVGTNHVNEADGTSTAQSGVFVFDRPADPRMPWTKRVISTGILSRPSEGSRVQGAPGVFGAGDIDGDGDVDIAVSGDGDARTFWLEQTSPGQFVTHVLEEKLGQAGGAIVADIDGDGRNELVFAGYEDDVVRVYAREVGK